MLLCACGLALVRPQSAMGISPHRPVAPATGGHGPWPHLGSRLGVRWSPRAGAHLAPPCPRGAAADCQRKVEDTAKNVEKKCWNIFTKVLMKYFKKIVESNILSTQLLGVTFRKIVS
jgi:hypothetical protein